MLKRNFLYGSILMVINMKDSFLLSKGSFYENWGFTVRKTVLEHSYRLHCHDFFEIEIIADGEAEQNLNGKIYPLSKGSAYILRPTDFHSIEIKKPVTLYNIMFDEILLSDSSIFDYFNSPTEYCAELDGNQLDIILSQIQALQYETQQKLPMENIIKKNLLECIMINIIRKSTSPKTESNDIPLRSALSYINLNFKNNLNLNECAKVVGFTSAYFSNWFHKNTGKTYIEYVNSLRLTEAKRLLLTTNYSVTEICFASGFSSLSGFLKEFKKQYGITPSAFRKNLES